MSPAYLVGVVVAAYLGCLWLVNRVPHIGVKSFGWLCLKHVHVDFGVVTVHARKVYLRVNVFQKHHKLVELVLHDIQLHVSESRSTDTGGLTAPSFTLSKRGYLVVNTLLNQVTVVVNRCSVHVDHAPVDRLDIEYARLDADLHGSDGRVALSILHGTAKDILFRNLVFNVSTDVVTRCPKDKPDTIEVTVADVALHLSVGKLAVDAYDLGQRESVQTPAKEPADLPHTTGTGGIASQKPLSGSSHPLAARLEAVAARFPLLSSVEVRLEELELYHADFDVDVLSLVVLATHTSASAYLTSVKLFHLDTRCFELPSATVALHLDDDRHPLNVTLTNPKLDIYYDQITPLLSLVRRQSPLSGHTVPSHFFSAKVVVVDFALDLHLPHLSHHEDFHRASPKNNVVHAQLLGLVYRLLSRRDDRVNGFVKFKNFKLDVADNYIHFSKMSVIVGYNLPRHELSVHTISKNIHMSSVNVMLFQIVRLLRNISVEHYNTRCAELFRSPDPGPVSEYTTLMALIPAYVVSIKSSVSSISADIICKDGLPPHEMFDAAIGESIDLGDFKRGVSFRVSDGSFSFKRARESVLISVKTVQCSTLSEYVSEYISDFDHVAECHSDDDFSDLSSLASSFDNVSTKKIKRVLSVRDIAATNEGDALVVRVPEVDGRFDIFLVWCTIYARNLLHYFAPTVERKYQHRLPSSKIRLDVVLELAAIVTRLPNAVDVLVEVDTLSLNNVMALSLGHLKYARLYVVHPSTKLWARLLTVNNALVEYDGLVTVDSRSIKLNIPHQFLFYTVIDNIVTLVKAIRQINHNFRNLEAEVDDYNAILPDEKPAVQFPEVTLNSTSFGLVLENDPFENELSYIFELGLLEQRRRLQKQKLFDKKCAELRARVHSPEDLTFAQPEPRHFIKSVSTPRFNSPLRQVTSSQDKGPSLTAAQAEAKIEEARQLNLEELSASWISAFREFRAVKTAMWAQRAHDVWGEEIINPLVTDKFEIQEYAYGAPLLGGLLRNLRWTVRASLVDVDQFLHDHGKGQPKLAYSILIPLNTDLRASSLYMFLRDYPFPVLAFPENATGNSVHLRGDVVINEKLITRKEELRYIFVPFSPALSDTDDNFYSVRIPRTLTPVKFMINLEWDLNTDTPCVISWCKLYQAAFSLVMSAFDNFTKPEIDDSPLGWWDKMALLVHGKMAFNIRNQLCLHIKSGTSPYETIGRHAGFVWCWQNNVSLQINPGGRHDELIRLESDDFVLAIPEYPQNRRFFDEIREVQYLKKVMKFLSDEKVCWKLGLLFERNTADTSEISADQERTAQFKPHYDVMVTNPAFAFHPDSYTNFRSDYLHLAISVTSKSAKGNLHNAAYLTPMAFHYFYYWWDLLTEYVSLPIRMGPLFQSKPKDLSHVKLGPHLLTVKYQLALEPLNVLHLYVHSKMINDNDRVAFTGIKGKFQRCTVDLHQRKELVRYVNEKLAINNRIPHLKMNQGQVDIAEADIRVVSAVFNDKSMTGHLASYLNGLDYTLSLQGRSDLSLSNDFLEDVLWVDTDDFVELEMRQTLSPFPRLEVIPMLQAPRFTYFREFSSEDGKYPFGHEDAHECLLGVLPNQTQVDLTAQRIEQLEAQILLAQTFLAKLEYADDHEFDADIVKVRAEIDADTAKVAQLRAAVGGMECEEALQGAAAYHNRFFVHNMRMKWNNELRNIFLDYIQKQSERKSQVYYMSRQALDLVDAVIKDSASAVADEDDKLAWHPAGSSEEVLKNFDRHFTHVEADQEREHKYLFRLIHPQIQLVSNKDPESCVLITSRSLNARILAVNLEGTADLLSDAAKVASNVENRIGVLFEDSHTFVFEKDSPLYLSWPPWLDCEVCYDTSFVQQQLVIERNTSGLVFVNPNELLAESTTKQGNEIRVHLSKVVIDADSRQYLTLYHVVTDLLVHSNTAHTQLINRLNKVMSMSDVDDFAGMDERVRELQDGIRLSQELLLWLDAHTVPLNKHEHGQVRLYEMELERMRVELILLMRGLSTRRSKSASKRPARFWQIHLDQVIWHLLDGERLPFIDFALADSTFMRVDSNDGSNSNKLAFLMIQGFNLQEHAVYPELLRPYKQPMEEPIAQMTWRMLDPIGGIPIMQQAKLEIHPLQVQLDYHTARRLFEYIFPDSGEAHEDVLPDNESVSLKPSANSSQPADDIQEIMMRSSKYISIVDIEVAKMDINVSFKPPKHLHILDVHNLHMTIPTLRYRNKTWSGEDFIVRLRKDIIKVILNHTGKIIGNKFLMRKRDMVDEPLKQIANYANYMTIQDLQSEGRDRRRDLDPNGDKGV